MTYGIHATGSGGSAVKVPEIGQRVRVLAGTLPTHLIYEYDGDPKNDYLVGEIVSIRLNKRGITFKIAVRAEWSGERWFFDDNLGYSVSETGPVEKVKYFSFPLSSVGRTVFFNDE